KSEFCQPMRTKVDSGSTGLLLTMPCYSAPDSALACKLVTVFPGNTDLSICKLWLDAEEITCIRTAAASAVASRHLAHPQSRTLALLGSGAQAFSHFEAIATLFAMNASGAQSEPREASCSGRKDYAVEDCESAKAAVDQADIVCTVTSSRDQPCCAADWLPRCPRPVITASLTSIVTTRAAFLVADSRESGEPVSRQRHVIVNKATVHAELGELIAHPERSARPGPAAAASPSSSRLDWALRTPHCPAS
uniref:Ketimine reductase mu-crystallin n=1 Tax=Macrostomum lignano TaxID=282301 RepID=A0A1I8FN45_9PLAT